MEEGRGGGGGARGDGIFGGKGGLSLLLPSSSPLRMSYIHGSNAKIIFISCIIR
jgi:hypothetical protein